MPMEYKNVSRPGDIPRDQHFAIFEGNSFYIPGDERSRTNPGHGYPASTEYAISYRAYSNRAEWEAEIKRLSERQKDFRACVITPATITTSVDVAVSTPN